MIGAMASPRLACLACDLVLRNPSLAEGERALCPRCRHPLKSRPRDGLVRSLAFAVGAATFLATAIAFPFLSLKIGGFDNAMTLLQTAARLYQNGMGELAALVLGFILIIPAALLAAVLALLVPLVRRRNAPWLVPTGRLVFALGPWCMVEVFVIGVIVSLVKLASMATVVLGISFWSYAAFAVCFTASISSLDRMLVWDAIEEMTTG